MSRLRYCQKHWPAAGSALGTIPLWWKTPIHGTRSKPFWPCCRSLSAFKHGWKPPPFGELFCCFCFIGAASNFRFLCLRRHDMRVVLRNSWTAPCQPLTPLFSRLTQKPDYRQTPLQNLVDSFLARRLCTGFVQTIVNFWTHRVTKTQFG